MFLAMFLALCFFIVRSKAVPPEECFANFRWDDCGQTPEPVIYYWKPGSRCEVGTWRGCLPNPNMFKNEDECTKTCIFDNIIYKRFDDVTGFEETLPFNVTVAADETSPSNVTMVPDYSTTVTVDGETLVPNVDNETSKDSKGAKSNDTTIPDSKLPSNGSLLSNETNTPASNDAFKPDDPAGSNKTPAEENEPDEQEKDNNKPDETPAQAPQDEAPNEQEKNNNKPDETPAQAPQDEAFNEQEKDDDKPDEEEKPVGRSRLASFLKGK
ncbi:PGC-1 and ERR-induced regulator in muscle protein 1-like isoform X2 [Aricia agestis]|uniref:PGC-1 and ERR-induced regulator in muscle protein 1-like isoform X2 n=1 Tax=Aricia agestis TaxID=91739 RepID=UPI001C20249B|nr:PGC-1 and ERR-induced regulator in muscle protein 1-like isoform X2 [Aricia agestis]